MKAVRRQYTAQEKCEIVLDVAELGVCQTARKHGVRASNVSRWCKEKERWLKAGGHGGRESTSRKGARAEGNAALGRVGLARRQYCAEEKERILRDVLEFGVSAAARKHGVHASNVSRWCKEKERRGKSNKHGQQAGAAGKSCGSERTVLGEVPAVKRVSRQYTPSERARVLEFASARSITEAAKRFGVTRWSVYEWQRKAKQAAAGTGADPTSGASQADLEAQRDREILAEWKKHPGLGPSQIRNQLRRAGVKVSVHTTRRVMEEAGYRPPKVKREPHDERYESVRPNHCWHLDFVHRHINRANTFTLILIDDYSRFVVGHGVDDAERAELVVSTFEEAVRRHGRPEMVMHDKGSAFWSWRGISRFTALLTELGVDQVVAEHKEWNGKLEVFNANLHKEFLDQYRFYDLAEMQRRLAAHLHWYNHARTHHALGGLLVPADRYYGRVEEVTARIEAGAGREVCEGELRERCLELFKVTSRNGVAEVWLLGQKLLGAASRPGGAVPGTRPDSVR
jgi:putative transposase